MGGLLILLLHSGTPASDVELERACRAGKADACYQLYRKACNLQSARGCNNLAVLYENGHGVGADVSEALRLYRLACSQGEAKGCTGARRLAATAGKAR